MSIAAVICEYNPFHNGHKFHIEETKRQTGADGIIAVMSGNFVQRGEPAIFNKQLRAASAILGGADLVLELPAIYSCASAEFFAKGAIKILDALGQVNFLSFGAETPCADSLTSVASLLANEPPEFSAKLKQYLNAGMSYPSARSAAVCDISGKESSKLLASPNNILGIEYCKALLNENSSITPIPILRKGAEHDSQSPQSGIASASHIRALIVGGDIAAACSYMPEFSKSLFSDATVHSLKALEKSILAELVKTPANSLKIIADVSEGIENRIKSAALTANTLGELIDAVKTKRYTHSRIRRIILSAYLGITHEMRAAAPPYIKILDHNKRGREIIAAAKKSASLPVVRNTSQINRLQNSAAKAFWEQERIFDRIFELSSL